MGQRMFSEKYPEVYSLLVSYFSDPVDDALSDREIALEAAAKNPPDVVLRAVCEAERLLAVQRFPWVEVSDAANRCLPNEARARAWLAGIVALLKDG